MVGGNCLFGDRGEDAGDDNDEVLLLRRAGEPPWATRWWTSSPTASSSGNGPRVEWDEEAEDTPDMADTDCRSSCCCCDVRDATKEFWIAA